MTSLPLPKDILLYMTAFIGNSRSLVSFMNTCCTHYDAICENITLVLHPDRTAEFLYYFYDANGASEYHALIMNHRSFFSNAVVCDAVARAVEKSRSDIVIRMLSPVDTTNDCYENIINAACCACKSNLRSTGTMIMEHFDLSTDALRQYSHHWDICNPTIQKEICNRSKKRRKRVHIEVVPESIEDDDGYEQMAICQDYAQREYENPPDWIDFDDYLE